MIPVGHLSYSIAFRISLNRALNGRGIYLEASNQSFVEPAATCAYDAFMHLPFLLATLYYGVGETTTAEEATFTLD